MSRCFLPGLIIALLCSVNTEAQQAQPQLPQPQPQVHPQPPPNNRVNVSGQVPPGPNQPRTLPSGYPNGIFNSGTNQVSVIRTNLPVNFGTNANTQVSNTLSSSSNQDSGLTNGMSLTNHVPITNRSGLLQPGDRAATPADQNLLATIQEVVRPVYPDLLGNQLMPVQFTSRGGVVTIKGFVADLQQKQTLVRLVGAVPGVAQVLDQLQVAAPGNMPAASAPSAQSAASALSNQALTAADQSIVQQLQLEMKSIIGDAGPVAPVQITSRDGVVTLTGIVPTPQLRQQIFLMARRAPGVVQVNNQIQVNVQAGVNTAGNAPGVPVVSGASQSTSSSVSGTPLNQTLTPTGNTNTVNRIYPNNQNQPVPLR